MKRGEAMTISREVLAALEEDCTNYVSNECALDSADPLARKPFVQRAEIAGVRFARDANGNATSYLVCGTCVRLFEKQKIEFNWNERNYTSLLGFNVA